VILVQSAKRQVSIIYKTFRRFHGFPHPARMGAAARQIVGTIRHDTPGRSHNARIRRDSGLCMVLWRCAMILHRVSVTYPRYTEGRSRNREPSESQRRIMMCYFFTRFWTTPDAGAHPRMGEPTKPVHVSCENSATSYLRRWVRVNAGQVARLSARMRQWHTAHQWVEYTWARLGGSHARTSRFPQLVGAAGPRMRLRQSVTRN